MAKVTISTAPSGEAEVPRESLGRLFRRFLRFGFLAWGGPVAQIDMIRNELVAQERWVTPDYFRRLLAVYQVLPGPEASELCVHFGMLARGRWGGLLAGLGFMFPGFALMLFLSWFYLRAGNTSDTFQAVFLGVQPAVVALIVRACHRIGRHCLTDLPLWAIATLAAGAELFGTSFWVTLLFGGLAYVASTRRNWIGLGLAGAVFVALVLYTSPVIAGRKAMLHAPRSERVSSSSSVLAEKPTQVAVFGSGVRAGLLTFGGAYTAIPFLQKDAVEQGGWMTEHDFLDGLALSGILPAPLIIFSTFVGYFGGGFWGAVIMTIGVFLPAFCFPLLLHRHLDALIQNAPLRHFLEGVTAGVVGLIAVTTVRLAIPAVPNFAAAIIAVVALITLYSWNSRIAVPVVMLAAGLAGAWVLTK
jgi:chromate transporter